MERGRLKREVETKKLKHETALTIIEVLPYADCALLGWDPVWYYMVVYGND